MFLNPSASPFPELLFVVVVGLGIVGFAVGIAWLRRITRVEDEGDDPWRFRR